MILDILFIGAGFSNLAAANKLLDYDISNFAILEKGKPLLNRTCIGEINNTCKFCKVCHTIEGVGGANALHGNKLCYFPASKKITDDFSEQDIVSSLSFLSKLLNPYFEMGLNLNDCISNNNLGFQKKKYISDAFLSEDFSVIVNILTSKIRNKIFSNTNIVSIAKKSDYYSLEAESGEIYKAKRIIFGTGRSSYSFLTNILKSLDASYVQQPQDVGIRIEADSDCFTAEYYYQADPKLKYDFGNLGSARTFCAHNKGMVVPVRFGESFFADGAFSSTFLAKNNIALMVRTRDYLSNEILEKWCKKINSLANNNLILGDIVMDDKFISNFKQMVPFFPTKSHAILIHKILNKLLFGEKPILKENSKITIYAPAIDLQWVKPQLKRDFSLVDDDNIYVLGDAAGKSRGFVQALFSGVMWADLYCRSITINKSEKTWLNLV